MSDFGFYFRLGWAHIMSPDALDHILFLLALAALYTLADWRRMLVLVTAFTIGHSATLALSTLNVLNVPTALVEFLIPCTIIITAVSNLFQKSMPPKNMAVNYFLAFFFGLVHGLGFANTLRFILAGDQSLGWALFGFNIGLEAGQVVIVFILLLGAQLAIRFLAVARRDWLLFLSAAVFSLAVQLALQRWPGRKPGDRSGKSGIRQSNTEYGVLKKFSESCTGAGSGFK